MKSWYYSFLLLALRARKVQPLQLAPREHCRKHRSCSFLSVSTTLRGGASLRSNNNNNNNNSGSTVDALNAQQIEGQDKDNDEDLWKKKVINHRTHMWVVPIVAALGSYFGFQQFSSNFRSVVQYLSENTWIPTDEAQLNLQTNVVTQVVNGPVITSVSVLFASLVSMTISELHSRQVDIRSCFSMEVLALRQVTQLLQSRTAIASLDIARRKIAIHLVVQHTSQLIRESREGASSLSDSHLMELLSWCHDYDSGKHASKPLNPVAQDVVSQVQLLSQKLLEERCKRCLAFESMQFPAVHYVTLGILAVSIGIAFLVAIFQADFFLKSLQIRILWSVLMGSFTALAVVCYDLSLPFRGAYQILTSINAELTELYDRHGFIVNDYDLKT